ncbi:LamG domain-containing protein, partial [Nanoarchaeota archaeon]
ETTYFIAQDNINPSVFDVIPPAGSEFSGGQYIEIGANATDNGVIHTVFANITFPNSTIYQITLYPASGDKFNNSFLVPYVKGMYNVTFTANDTNGNINDSEWTYFIVRNILPTHDNPILVSSSGQNVSTDDLIAYPQNVTDIDGDNVTTIPDWRLNKTSIAVLNMPFDSNKSSNYTDTVRDYSTYGNNGILGQGNYSRKPEWASYGRIGGAYNFDGIDDYIHIGDAADFTNSQSFTIEAWINLDSNGTGRIVSKKDSDAASDPGYQLTINSNNELEARIADGTNIVIKNSTAITSGTWYHVAMVVDRTAQTAQVYIDGQAQGTPTSIAPTSLNPSTTSPLRIGSSSYTNPTEFFNGTIDEVIIYDRALSSAQLLEHYMAGNSSNNYLTLDSEETDAAETWEVAITPNDGFGDGITKISNNLTLQVNTAPTMPLLVYPENNASIINRTPKFTWNNSYDADNDSLTYRIVVDDDPLFSTPEIDVNNIPETPTQTNYSSTVELEVDTIYYWRVIADDNKTLGNWSYVFNFTLESYAAISLIVDVVNFSTVLTSSTDNTTDGYPPPFILENQGNIHVNVSINGSPMFQSGAFPSENLQFKIDVNESSSFDYSSSTTTWTNITSVSSSVDIASLDWHDLSDTAETDILIRVPEEEPPGDRNSTITFSVI